MRVRWKPTRFVIALLAPGVSACAPISMPDGGAEPDGARAVDVARLDVGEAVPEFILRADDGGIVENDDLPGDVLIVAFYSATGPSASSSLKVLGRISEVLERLRAERRSRVHALAVALDADLAGEPLAAQADRLELGGPGWTIASGPREQLERMAAAFGVAIWPDSGAGLGHTLATTVVASGRVSDRFFGIAEWSVPDLLGAVSSATRLP